MIGKTHNSYSLFSFTLLASGRSAGSIDIDCYFQEPVDKFLDEAQELRSTIVAKTLGHANTALRDKLLDLQKHLLREISLEEQDVIEWDSLRQSLVDGDYSNAVSVTKEIVSSCDTTRAKKVESIICELTR